VEAIIDRTYDLIIIGAGPAGITASIYAARKRMDSLVITKDIGGQTAWTGDIENYASYQLITGAELTKKFEEHMKKYGINIMENDEVSKIVSDGEGITVKTGGGIYKCRTLIVASGKRSRELNVPGEKEFKNKGVAFCATCDAPFFAGKDVAVVGGGNSALDAALGLVKIARHTYIINITGEMGGDAIMREKVMNNESVTVMNNSTVTAINGAKFVESININRQGREEKIPVQGIFIEIGLIPNSEFESEIKKNEIGEIIVNSRNETNVPGIFAAGDVTNIPDKQIIIAAGEGAKAALEAFAYLVRRR